MGSIVNDIQIKTLKKIIEQKHLFFKTKNFNFKSQAFNVERLIEIRIATLK